jgi:putative phosphoesterase
MPRIGLISDTHGVWAPGIDAVLPGVSHIIHAGDIGSEEMLERLERIAPLTAVKGNMDTGPLALCPEFTLVELEGARIFITHILGRSAGMKGDAMKAIRALMPDIVVYGHTHMHLAEKNGRFIFVNPGSAGQNRYGSKRRTFADIDFGEEFITVNFYDAECRTPVIIDSVLFPFER